MDLGLSAGARALLALAGAGLVIGFMWAGWGAAGAPAGSVAYVSLLGAALIIPASVLAAPWGAGLAHGIFRRRLEVAFGAFLGVIAIRYLVNLLG